MNDTICFNGFSKHTNTRERLNRWTILSHFRNQKKWTISGVIFQTHRITHIDPTMQSWHLSHFVGKINKLNGKYFEAILLHSKLRLVKCILETHNIFIIFPKAQSVKTVTTKLALMEKEKRHQFSSALCTMQCRSAYLVQTHKETLSITAIQITVRANLAYIRIRLKEICHLLPKNSVIRYCSRISSVCLFNVKSLKVLIDAFVECLASRLSHTRYECDKCSTKCVMWLSEDFWVQWTK